MNVMSKKITLCGNIISIAGFILGITLFITALTYGQGTILDAACFSAGGFVLPLIVHLKKHGV